jgi:hypothetical protein
MAEAFQPRFVDLVRNYTSTTGSGNFVLGAAAAGYRSFGSAIQPGESFYYSAIGIDKPDEFEVGRGTMQPDGSISRDPSGGALTKFTDGSKTVALVAAAEWYEGVQSGSAGTLSVAETRDELALCDTSKPAMLHEEGRAGLFVFDPSDLSSEVAADRSQGMHVAPQSDPSGASGAWVRRKSGAVEARWFGAKGDGVTDEASAIQAAIDYVGSIGGGVVRLGGGTFSISEFLAFNSPDVTLDARGATVTSAMDFTTTLIYLNGTRCRILGGTWKLTSGSDNPYFLEIDGIDGEVDGACFIKEPEAGGLHGYLRVETDGFVMRNCRTEGSNGLQCEGRNCAFISNRFVGRSVGGDDAIAIKAIGGQASNIRIVGNSFENLAFFCSIGSEIGVRDVDDPSYSRGVYNVVVAGNCGTACSGLLFVKPGAISNYDYRDGTVEGIVVSDNILRDESGTKFTRGIAITAARGARVRNITGKNNLIVARTDDDSGRHIGALDVYIPDYSALSAAVGPTISDIDIGIEFSDPHDGAAAGSAGIPGFPTGNIVAVEKQSAEYGSISNIVIDVKGNGSQFSGIVVQDGLDDAVHIRRAVLTNINVDGSSLFGGIQYKSRISIGSHISIKMADGSQGKPYKIADPAGEIVSQVDHVFVAGTIPAGTDSTRAVRWAAPRNAFLHKVEILSSTAINQSGSDTNYTQHELRNENGASIPITASSKLSGGQTFPANAFKAILRAADLSGTTLADCYFSKGYRLSYTKNDFGSGNALTDAVLRIHWAPF